MVSVRGVSALLVFCVAALPLAPVTHVHETGGIGHHDRLVHSHSEAHHQRDAHAPHDGATFDDQDTVVLTFDPVFALPHPSVVPATPVVHVRLTIEPPAADAFVAPVFIEPLIHGPPRAPAAVRGPPRPSLL